MYGRLETYATRWAKPGIRARFARFFGRIFRNRDWGYYPIGWIPRFDNFSWKYIGGYSILMPNLKIRVEDRKE